MTLRTIQFSFVERMLFINATYFVDSKEWVISSNFGHIFKFRGESSPTEITAKFIVKNCMKKIKEREIK